jgi:hypothetical protein
MGRLFRETEYKIEIEDFNPLCSGAALSVLLGTDKIRLPLLTVAASQTDRKMKGAVILPAEVKAKAANNNMIQKFIRDVFGVNNFTEIMLNIDGDGVVQVRSNSFILNAR